MDAVAGQRAGHPRRQTPTGQANPQVPVGKVLVAAVEGANGPKHCTRHHGVGAPAWHQVKTGDPPGQLLRAGWRCSTEDAPVGVDPDRPPYTHSRPVWRAAWSWRASLSGAHRSSSSQNPSHSPAASAIPRFRAAATPCGRSLRSNRTRPSPSPATTSAGRHGSRHRPPAPQGRPPAAAGCCPASAATAHADHGSGPPPRPLAARLGRRSSLPQRVAWKAPGLVMHWRSCPPTTEENRASTRHRGRALSSRRNRSLSSWQTWSNSRSGWSVSERAMISHHTRKSRSGSSARGSRSRGSSTVRKRGDSPSVACSSRCHTVDPAAHRKVKSLRPAGGRSSPRGRPTRTICCDPGSLGGALRGGEAGSLVPSWCCRREGGRRRRPPAGPALRM